MRWARAAALTWTLAATAGCSSLQCAAVGCVSVATVRVHGLTAALDYPVTVRTCFDRRCVHVTLPARARTQPQAVTCTGGGRHVCTDQRSSQGTIVVAFDQVPPGPRRHVVSLTARDAHGRVVVRGTRTMRLTKTAPNGERCGPICWDGTTDFR